MTVRRLIDLLRRVDGDLPVFFEADAGLADVRAVYLDRGVPNGDPPVVILSDTNGPGAIRA